MATDEVKHIEHVETSVRAAIIGKGGESTERDMDRSAGNSPAKYDISKPGRNIEMDNEIGIEDWPARSWDLRFISLERSPAVKRGVEDEDDTMWGSAASIDASLRTTVRTRSA